jgi:hypothetical protein
MNKGRTAACAASAALCLLALSRPADLVFAAKPPPATLQLRTGSRIALVNLLDAEVTHFHGAPRVQDSHLKTYPVGWAVAAMLTEALKEPLQQLGLVSVPLGASDALAHAREACFINAALAKGLPKACSPPFVQLASAEHVDAIIVLGPGLNDSAHAAGTRRRDLPDYLRGWCFVTTEGSADGTPGFLNLTELLLITVSPKGAEINAREWGGSVAQAWTGFTAQVDLKAIPAAQLNELQPLYGAMLKEQAARLLAHVEVAH